MKMKKSLTTLAITLALGAATTAFAASADSFTDVPKDHWSYAALDELVKDGIIEGYGDSTFQGNRMMSRYEMATIVAKAMDKVKSGSLGDQALVEKLEKEYGGELEALNKKVDALDKKVDETNARVDKFKISGLTRVQSGTDDGKNMNYNNRFYMDLEGEMKVSDMWRARFTIEKNAQYKSSEPIYENKWVSDGTATGGKWSKVPHTHAGKDNSANDQDHNGSVSNVWVEGTIAGNWYVNAGRKWNGIGYQNLLWGNPCDGAAFYHPVSKDWMVSGLVWSPTWDGAKYTMAAGNIFGKLTKTIDANVAYARIVNNKDDYWTGADMAYSIDLRAHLTPTLTATASYVKTNADQGGGYWKDKSDLDRDFAYRLDYKGTNISKVGSFGMYAKYVDMGATGDFGHDDEWTTRGPSYSNGNKGWYVGINYVPWQNVEWSTMYAKVQEGTSVAAASEESDRKIIRTQLDYHF